MNEERIDRERKQDEEKCLRDRQRKDSWYGFLNDWSWEWFCSMNLPHGSVHSDAEKKLKKWRIKLSTREKIQIAYQGVFNLVPHPHIHLVALGKCRMGIVENLYGVSHTLAEVYWSQIAKGSAVIQPIGHDWDTVYRYIADKNNPAGLSEMVSPYNKKLLEKRRI
jgi:hypothetical protein